jgi:WD40 repeat protein
MASTLTCKRGHSWTTNDDQLARGGEAICPHCGAVAVEAGATLSFPTLALRGRREQGAGPSTPADRVAWPDPLEATLSGGLPTDVTPPPTRKPEIPGFDILEEIGRGGMGVVYRARQIALDRIVAVKMIHAGPHTNSEILARFRAEAEVIARLQHPSRLDGVPQPARTAAMLVRTMARAIHAAHEKGVIHRDLKPSNIQLADGPSTPLDRCVPKICDFGLARRLDVMHGITMPGQILGTPGYMPPEQAQGPSEKVGPAADIYALGVLLYEALVGHPPFCGTTSLETVHLMLLLEPLPPSRLRPGLPRDLETVCLRCLEKDPARRYPSAGELADDLGRFLDDQPVRARPISSWERLWKWARRQPGTAALASCVIVLVLLTLGLLTWLWRRAETEQFRIDRDRAEAIQLASKESSARQEAQRLAVRLLFDRGIGLCETGEHSAGLLTLLRGLERVPPGEESLEHSARMLLGGWAMQMHPLRYYHRHLKCLQAVAYTADGSILATGNDAREVRFYDPQTGRLLRPPIVLPGKVVLLSRTAAAGLVAVVESRGAVQVHELDGGRLLGPPITGKSLPRVALSPDGEVLLIGEANHTARTYRVRTGEPLSAPWMHPLRVSAVAFSPDGRLAVTGCHDWKARLWQVADGKLLRTFDRHRKPIISVAISPDGSHLLTGGADRRACLWRLADGELRQQLWHPHEITSVAFSANNRMMATGCHDNLARIFEVETGMPFGAGVRHLDDIMALAFSPDGQSLATASHDDTLRVWQVNPQAGSTLTLAHPPSVLSIALSPDGKRLLSSASDATLRLWDLQRQQFQQIKAHERAVTVAYRPDGKVFLVGDVSGQVRQYDSATGSPVGAPLVHSRPVLSAVYGPDGRLIATGCEDRGEEIHIWDAAQGKLLRRWQGHTRKVFSVAFSPDGQTLASASWDFTVRLWNVSTGREIGKPMRHLDLVQSVAFSPERKWIISGGDDSMVRFWNLPNWSPGPHVRLPDKVQAVAVSRHGRLFATGTKAHEARLWDVESGRPVGPPLRHAEEVHSLGVTADGHYLFSGSWDGTVRRWPIPSAKTGSLDELRLWLEIHNGQRMDASDDITTLTMEEWEAQVRKGTSTAK